MKREMIIQNKLIDLVYKYDLIEVNSKEELSKYFYKDLVNFGVLDSLGLVILQDLVKEEFSVRIQPEVFFAELRTLKDIIAYLTRTVEAA